MVAVIPITFQVNFFILKPSVRSWSERKRQREAGDVEKGGENEKGRECKRMRREKESERV